MRIAEVKIRNFRKLKEVTIHLQDDTTVFIGANNSGKTTAMIALRHFLKSDNKNFSIYDFTLNNHEKIKEIGLKLENKEQAILVENDLLPWVNILPSLDLWFDISDNDIHYVSHILPTLDWSGGCIGVRLQFEPRNIVDFYNEYKEARKHIEDIKLKAKTKKKNSDVDLFPADMLDFLKRDLQKYFIIKYYTLDPTRRNGVQSQETLGEPIDSNPLTGLIKINEINAQRGLNDETPDISPDDQRRLSKQLTNYYSQHFDPSIDITEDDIEALDAIFKAQQAFTESMTQRFKPALSELSMLGYPGFYNPNITINPNIKPTDGLDHDSALQYELDGCKGSFLPETYNGLGYQNLIFIAFKLMSFRDSRLKIGKQRTAQSSDTNIEYPPIHLVLVEEPEAHLHPPAQQVFIKQAYKILTNKNEIKTGKLTTQLVVTTHSSHITHECYFSQLRYFKRILQKSSQVQSTEVINLSNIFGSDTDTEKFVSRYIKITHCDLFFADAAILIEGEAERILLPAFICKFTHLNQTYISILNIGGSHAHRLRTFIENLSIPTLIITDIDATGNDGKSEPVVRGQGQKTNNDTLKKWFPQKESIDELLELSANEKESKDALRVAFQTPVVISGNEILPYTFEDSLIFENKILIDSLTKAKGMLKKAKNITDAQSAFDIIYKDHFKKAEFALDILYLPNFDDIKIPAYIAEGLQWLENTMEKKMSHISLVSEKEE